MRYIATVFNGYDRHAMSFTSEKAAEKWLDENNHNLEHRTMIEEFDDDWTKLGGFIYTEGKE